MEMPSAYLCRVRRARSIRQVVHGQNEIRETVKYSVACEPRPGSASIAMRCQHEKQMFGSTLFANVPKHGDRRRKLRLLAHGH